MKARRISLEGLPTPQSAMQRIVSVRFAEVLAQAGGMQTQRPSELHALRIGCKRLRYCIELFEADLPKLQPAAQRLRQLQDELGIVHDCDVLLVLAQEKHAQRLAHRLQRDRARHTLRARGLWADAFAPGGPLHELIAYTGFGALPA